MSEPTQEQVTEIVSSLFVIREIRTELGKMEFEIGDHEFKEKFVILAQKLERIGIVCYIHKFDERLIIQVHRLPPESHKKRIPQALIQRILFAVVVSFVMIDGFYRTQSVNSIINIGEPLSFAVLYTVSLMGILGVHEAGHIIAARIHKIRTSWPYFIPGIPVIGLPTFGALIQSRGLMINRDIVFDVAIAGPIAGLVIAILVSFYGAHTSPILDPLIASSLPKDELQNLNDSIFMQIALAAYGKAGPDVQVLMSPVLFAAWLGFLITFLNLLPAWQLDGGHMARTVFGQKIHRFATYGSVGVLFLLHYEMMAMFILIFSIRNMSVRPLDDASPLSKNRKVLYVVVVALAVLCAPLPFSIWSK
ncbi:MAG TPA: site-2 protease family protein [Candidatus Nitrosotenuis sp.]|nr:site-2 protease family protein [Candidatus Nitrosotenuis sp.]HIH46215.1 site-2 protease family protein [Candidatus Nitrosotenuis sp.]